MTKKNITIATEILAEMMVENKKMSLEEITELYNLTHRPTESKVTLFNKGITILLANEMIRQVKEGELTYKLTLKAKRVALGLKLLNL